MNVVENILRLNIRSAAALFFEIFRQSGDSMMKTITQTITL